jgi:hypothetical protein
VARRQTKLRARRLGDKTAKKELRAHLCAKYNIELPPKPYVVLREALYEPRDGALLQLPRKAKDGKEMGHMPEETAKIVARKLTTIPHTSSLRYVAIPNPSFNSEAEPRGANPQFAAIRLASCFGDGLIAELTACIESMITVGLSRVKSSIPN